LLPLTDAHYYDICRDSY